MNRIEGGYILQPRKFDSSKASKMSPITRELWFYLLRNVNHKDNGRFKRGQGFFQFSKIQEALSWYVGYRKMMYSKPQITKALRRLCEGTMTETMKATRGLVITICNYDYYQDPRNYEGNDEGSTKDSRRNFGGHTINKNDTRKKEDKDILSYILCDNPEKVFEFCDSFIKFIQCEKGNLAPKSKNLFQESCKTIDLLIRKDNFDLEHIRSVLKWAVKDDFWEKNVLSLAGLRKKTNGLTKFQKIASSYKNRDRKKKYDLHEQNKDACIGFIEQMMQEPDYEE